MYTCRYSVQNNFKDRADNDKQAWYVYTLHKLANTISKGHMNVVHILLYILQLFVEFHNYIF